LSAVFVFGWLLERRHGWWAPLFVFLLGGTAGMLLVAGADQGVAMGGNAGALALLAAWAMRDVLARRRGQEDDADLLGTLAIAVLLVLLPLATPDANALAGLVGGVVGIVLGLGLARMRER
jgi:drug/metabolite transporter (DMT)-like permease